MKIRVAELAARLVEAWTRLYTAGMSADDRQRRRAELESDVRDQLEDMGVRGYSSVQRATAIVWRAIRGVADDLLWRFETSTHQGATSRAFPMNTIRRFGISATIVAALTLGQTVISLVNGGTIAGASLAISFFAIFAVLRLYVLYRERLTKVGNVGVLLLASLFSAKIAAAVLTAFGVIHGAPASMLALSTLAIAPLGFLLASIGAPKPERSHVLSLGGVLVLPPLVAPLLLVLAAI